MTYDEFLNSIQEPIGGKHTFYTEVARLAVFSYGVSTTVSELSKENELLRKDIERLENEINSIRSDMRKMIYHVEPDLRYME
jgi:predicted RNase H-like nuclease (RuvC/YqgF family)